MSAKESHNEDRGTSSVAGRSFDPYNSLPPGYRAARLSGEGIIDLIREPVHENEPEKQPGRKRRAKLEVREESPRPACRQAGFDPYNSDG